MRRYSPPPELLSYLAPYDDSIQKLALKTRKLVIEEMAPCYEVIYDAFSAVALGFGWSERFSDGVVHVAVYAKHVNLGFNEGATLEDPERLLMGSGKRIRHITIENDNDLKRSEIRDYLRRAIGASREDCKKLGLTFPSPAKKQVISIVKPPSKKKRRPGK